MLQNKQLGWISPGQDPEFLGAAREDGAAEARGDRRRGECCGDVWRRRQSAEVARHDDASGWMEGVEKSQHPSLKIEMSVNNPVYLICRREASSPLPDVRDAM